jgi:hypothetical protein
MNFTGIEKARRTLCEDGFSSEVSSIMVETGFYIGHRFDATFYKNSHTFKAAAHVDTLDQIEQSCGEISTLAKSLHGDYDCDITLRKTHNNENNTKKTESSPVAPIDSSLSSYSAYLELMDRGWGYSDTIGFVDVEPDDQAMRRLSISRWTWHGKELGTPVTLFQSFDFDESPSDVLHMLIERSFKAWNDFPDAIPFQDTNGKLRPSFIQTHLVFERTSYLNF